jgi:hypothetical protein
MSYIKCELFVGNYFKIYNDKNEIIKVINCKTDIVFMCVFALDAVPVLQLAVVQHL